MKKWCSRWAVNKKLPRASLPTPRLSRPNPPTPNCRPLRQRISVEEQYEKGYLKFQVAFPPGRAAYCARILDKYSGLTKTCTALARLAVLPCCLQLAALLRFFVHPLYTCARPNRCNIKYRIREPGLPISGSLQLGWPHGRSPFGQLIVN